MTATRTRNLSAVALLDLLRSYAPTVEGAELVFADEPPDDLWQMAAILQTGLRAILKNRRWFGIDIHGHSCGQYPSRGDGLFAFGALDPSKPIPQAVRLMIVEGEPRWDRILKNAHHEFPQLFGFEVTPREAIRRTSPTKHRSVSM